MGSFLVALMILLIIVGPFITIWSLNTLFALGIAYTWKTWIATIVLSSFFAAGRTRGKD